MVIMAVTPPRIKFSEAYPSVMKAMLTYLLYKTWARQWTEEQRPATCIQEMLPQEASQVEKEKGW